jgi:hypothetical protein
MITRLIARSSPKLQPSRYSFRASSYGHLALFQRDQRCAISVARSALRDQRRVVQSSRAVESDPSFPQQHTGHIETGKLARAIRCSAREACSPTRLDPAGLLLVNQPAPARQSLRRRVAPPEDLDIRSPIHSAQHDLKVALQIQWRRLSLERASFRRPLCVSFVELLPD